MPPWVGWVEFAITIIEAYIVWAILQAERQSIAIERSNLELYNRYFSLRSGWYAARLSSLRKAAAGSEPSAEGEADMGGVSAETAPAESAAGRGPAAAEARVDSE